MFNRIFLSQNEKVSLNLKQMLEYFFAFFKQMLD